MEETRHIRTTLQSKLVREKIDGLKFIISGMAGGENMSDYFADVVNTLASPQLEVKKLAYVYLLQYAHTKPDEVLLSINAFQKDLAHANPLVRSLSLRVLTSIRVHMIVGLQMLAIRKCVQDPSPYVRRAAANALAKVHGLDRAQEDELVSMMAQLLKDGSAAVVGASVSAFVRICPDRLELLHSSFRRLCEVLIDMDEFPQIQLLDVLLLYARAYFPEPPREHCGFVEGPASLPFSTIPARPVRDLKIELSSFYGDEATDAESRQPAPPTQASVDTEAGGGERTIDPDHLLLLRSIKPLLHSRNAGVVLGATAICYHTAPGYLGDCIPSLVLSMRQSRETQTLVLASVKDMAQAQPELFGRFLSDFYVDHADCTEARNHKLEILSVLVNEANAHQALKELQSYLLEGDPKFVSRSVSTIGRIALRLPNLAEACCTGLVKLCTHSYAEVVGESVGVLRNLIDVDPEGKHAVVLQLVRKFKRMTSPPGRANVLWLAGRYCGLGDKLPKVVPELLRVCAKNFLMEPKLVKLQIISLAANVLYKFPTETNELLFRYIMDLGWYDEDFDIRDKSRLFTVILLGRATKHGAAGQGESLAGVEQEMVFSQEQIGELLHPENSTVSELLTEARASHTHSPKQWRLGTISHVVGHRAPGYMSLANFPDDPPPTSIRDIQQAAQPGPSGTGGGIERGGNGQTEAFYADRADGADDSSEYSSSSTSSYDGSTASGSSSESDSAVGDGEDEEETVADPPENTDADACEPSGADDVGRQDDLATEIAAAGSKLGHMGFYD
mmetsp:Transcript_2032/g.7271  ORF Transcript_2032/g.7271 Transcript_2032/m.7271 type:complete len:788 (-) Transcript_2032:784-3147(-)